MKGVENVVLHAGHHEVVQWLGLTFNMDTLIATWVTMAIVILITADGEFLVIYVFLIYFCRK